MHMHAILKSKKSKTVIKAHQINQIIQRLRKLFDLVVGNDKPLVKKLNFINNFLKLE